MAHVVTHDPGDYYRAHFGCLAYDYAKGQMLYEHRKALSEGPEPYLCCNREIEQFDLTKARQALLEVLLLTSRENFEAFAFTLTCDKHRGEGQMTVAWTGFAWFHEMACTNRDWSGSCKCCNIRKPQYRWDAGLSKKDRQIALSLTAHMAPVPVPDENVINSIRPLIDNLAVEEQTKAEDVTNEDSDTHMAGQSQWDVFMETRMKQFNLVRLGVRDVAVVILAMLLSLMMLPLVIVS